MRTRRWKTVGVAVALLAVAAVAQDGAPDPLAVLRQGEVVIWVLMDRPADAPRPLVVAGTAPVGAPTTLQEATPSTFGQDASTYGTASSNVGLPTDTPAIAVKPDGTGYHEQTTGSFGQPSSNTGQTAGSYGQTASSLGQTSSSYGTASSNVGQTAGSYGNSLSTIATAGVPKPAAAVEPGLEHNTLLGDVRGELGTDFPELHVHYVSVANDELKARLLVASRRGDVPDLLIGKLPSVWSDELQSRYGVATLAASDASQTQVALLAQARHPDAARALVLWQSERGTCAGCVVRAPWKSAREAAAVDVATAVGSRLAVGASLGSLSDPAMAAIPAQLAGALGGAPDAPARVEVERVETGDHLAAVALRLVMTSRRSYLVVHPLVVLRTDAQGRWKVLHVSLNLEPAVQEAQAERLGDAAESATPDGEVKGIHVAAPRDGDSRPAQPQLWWDNGGGASLQVVEWQLSNGGGWSGARLQLVADDGMRLRTQVAARFASAPARYRWRVWSVGAHGAMTISGWNTLTINSY